MDRTALIAALAGGLLAPTAQAGDARSEVSEPAGVICGETAAPPAAPAREVEAADPAA